MIAVHSAFQTIQFQNFGILRLSFWLTAFYILTFQKIINQKLNNK